MAEKAGILDHRAVELIISSPDPSTYKRIGRGVPNFDSAVWDREKQDAVLSGTYAKFTQKTAMKKFTFGALTTNVGLKPALWTQCGALFSGQMIPGPTTHASREETFAW